MKKLLFVVTLATGALSTAQSLLGMQEGQMWAFHCSMCSCARNGSIQEFNTLLSNAAICNLIKPETIHTALKNAVFGNHIDIISAMISCKTIKSKIFECDIFSALRDAVKDDKIACITELLKSNILSIECLTSIRAHDDMSDGGRTLFDQAIQRKRQVL